MKPNKLNNLIPKMLLGTALFAGALPIANLAQATGAESKASQYAPDNSGRNTRDVQGGPLTPENQSENAADLKTTQLIRKAIVGSEGVSTLGKNVKIITIDGNVTLRGPVSSITEKDLIIAKATQVAGSGKVNNQLEINTK